MPPEKKDVRRVRDVLMKIRRNRKIFYWIAAITLLAWVSSIAVIVVDDRTENTEPQSPFADSRNSMAVATERADSFTGRQTSLRGFFNICPHDDRDWKITFSWTIVVSDDSAELPPLYLLIPADASQVTPEKKVEVDESGQVDYTPATLTRIREVRSTGTHKLLELKVDQPGAFRGTRLGFFGVNFHTSALDAGHSSMGERRFKVSHDPQLARNLGLAPGFGGARNRPDNGEKDLSLISCDLDALDGKEFKTETLDPTPTKTIAKGKLLWETQSLTVSTISGSTAGGWVYAVRTTADWIAVNALAGGIGAIYGVGIEAPAQPKDSGDRPQPTRSAGNSGTGSKSRTSRRRGQGKKR